MFFFVQVRSSYQQEYFSGAMILRWYESLRTPESISKHVAIFEQDLSQLVKHLKELVFLDIHGEIHQEKVEPYRSIIQTRFPNSRNNVELIRFRLWL
ncbi:unnamed protein product [Rotaria sp. Silwood2]|nr:unnamed protein product [Rotaria sp. Silwood2]